MINVWANQFRDRLARTHTHLHSVLFLAYRGQRGDGAVTVSKSSDQNYVPTERLIVFPFIATE
jgi:hypothetical protein